MLFFYQSIDWLLCATTIMSAVKYKFTSKTGGFEYYDSHQLLRGGMVEVNSEPFRIAWFIIFYFIYVFNPPPATCHPPPVTRHPSPVTRYPSPATRHPPPAEKSCRPRSCDRSGVWKSRKRESGIGTGVGTRTGTGTGNGNGIGTVMWRGTDTRTGTSFTSNYFNSNSISTKNKKT